MFKNRNGYWMSPEFMAMYAPDDGAGNGGESADNGGTNADAGQDNGGDGENAGGGQKNDIAAEVERLKADLARQKAALDAATKEAGDYRKQLRAKQTQEEIDAANKREAEEKRDREMEELRREVARARSTKSVMSKLGISEDSAGKIAEYMAGCEDIDNALLLIQKEWEAKEKALRIEFGKIPGPGVGGNGGEDAEEKAALEIAKRLGRERAESNKSVSEGLKGYIR